MRREGRQHGWVRSRTKAVSPTPPKSRLVNQLDSPPAAGLYTKVSSKPTNHSKFTGKCRKPMCRYCHSCPPNKSKDKGKGTQKLRHGLWAVEDLEVVVHHLPENQLSIGDGSPIIEDEGDASGLEIEKEVEIGSCNVGIACEYDDGDWFFVGYNL